MTTYLRHPSKISQIQITGWASNTKWATEKEESRYGGPQYDQAQGYSGSMVKEMVWPSSPTTLCRQDAVTMERKNPKVLPISTPTITWSNLLMNLLYQVLSRKGQVSVSPSAQKKAFPGWLYQNVFTRPARLRDVVIWAVAVSVSMSTHTMLEPR